jgi:uncharacterized protein YaaR (DUF327 family)
VRIEDIRRSSAGIQKPQPADGRPQEVGQAGVFRRRIGEASAAEQQKRLSELANSVLDQGDVIKSRMDLKEVQRYKELLTELLYEAGNAFAFEKQDKLDSWGRPRSLAIIKTINAKADDMTKEILKEQRDNIRVLELVDELRGLILDLFM